MAFVMANMAGVQQASSVLDPFCGTAGVLLAAVAVGADPRASLGVDIDPAVLLGKCGEV